MFSVGTGTFYFFLRVLYFGLFFRIEIPMLFLSNFLIILIIWLIKISLMRFLFNEDGCGARKTSGTDGIATCWEWESSRSRVSRRRPHPQMNYCRPQRRQWQSRHKHSTWSSCVTVPHVYYSRKITHYAGIMPNAV